MDADTETKGEGAATPAGSFPPGSSGLARLIREFDWAATALGPIETWPASLRAMTAFVVGSPAALVMLWGPDGVMIYNDAYADFAGGRHPRLLGQKVLEAWPEVADLNALVMKTGLAGETLSFKDQELVLNRTGSPEACWVDLDYSPVHDDSGAPAGVMAIVVETTAKVLADRALAGERTRLKVIFEQAPSFMVLLDGPQHRIELANPNYMTLVGHRPVLGKTVDDALPEAAAQGYVDLLDQVYRSGEPFHGNGATFNAQAEPGGPIQRRILDFVYQPIRDGEGAVSGIFVQGIDVTDRAKAEQRRKALSELTDLIREAEDPVALGYGASAIVGGVLGASRVGYSRIDPDKETLITDRDWTADGVASIAGVLALRTFGPFIDSLKAGEILVINDVDIDPRTSPGAGPLRERHAGAFVNVPVLDRDRLAGVFFVNNAESRVWTAGEIAFIREAAERTRTATERLRLDEARRAAVEALQRLNATLESQVAQRTAERNILARILEETDAFVHVVDLDYRWLAINRAGAVEFERVFGTLPRVGDRMLDLLDDQPAERAAVEAVWGRALAGEEFTAVSEFGDPARVGMRHSYEMKFNNLRDAEGRRIGAFQMVTDITDRVRADAELALTQEALRQSQKMEAMGQLTGGVAHDFNNLLTPIIGSLDVLQRRLALPEREGRLVEGALQAADRAKTLVQRLLAFARRQPLQSGAVDVAALIAGMADLVDSTAGPQIKVMADAPDGLPPALADANQLEMAILNLCVNARDAMPAGGTITIAARAERPPPELSIAASGQAYLRVSVIDTGEGMDEDTARRAVEPFFSTKGVGKGTGLGLSMVHGLASQLGGVMSITTRPGAGTRVDLWLPISRAQAAAPAAVAVRATPGAFRGRALVVDDEALVRMTTVELLQGLGYETDEADDAREAVARLEGGQAYDLVVTDHLMPGMTGADLAAVIRERWPAAPVLIISGYAEVQGIDPDLPRLTKPFRQAELADAIAGMVG